MMKRYLQITVGLVVSALFLWIALRGLDFEQVTDNLRGAQYGWLLPTILLYFVTVGTRAWRWHYLLRPLKAVPYRQVAGAVIIGYLGNNIYPLRIGELLRVYVLNRQAQLAMTSGITTVFVERLFDGLAVLTLVFVALPFTPLQDKELQTVIITMSLLFLGATAVFLLLATKPQQAHQFAEWLSQYLIPVRWRERFLQINGRFLASLTILRHPHTMVVLWLSSIAIWLVETIKYWLIMQAFPFVVQFSVLMLTNGIVNLTTILPSAPGFVGTFDWSGSAVLIRFHIPKEIATAYILVLHAALWLPSAVFGSIYMLIAGWRWTDLGRVAEAKTSPRD